MRLLERGLVPRGARRLVWVVVGALLMLATLLAVGASRSASTGSQPVGHHHTLSGSGQSVATGATAADSSGPGVKTGGHGRGHRGHRGRRGHPGRNSGFSIAGRAVGLYPGATLPLVLSVTNPQSFSITVTSISTAVTGGTARCRDDEIAVSPFAGELVVPQSGSASTTVSVAMTHSAPNGCQGATFTFEYSGSGRAS